MDDHEYAELLRQTMTELTHSFATPTGIDVTLQGVTAASVALIPGVDCADVLLISKPEQFESLAATSQRAVELDGAQRRFGQGPCLDAANGDAVVMCHDMRQERRWPGFAEAAIAAGIHSMLSFQLYTHRDRTGALNLFGAQPNTFGAEAEAVAAMLATQAAIALIAEDKELQFRSALASRDTIGQAKGMIMERFSLDAVRAFELLVRFSQNSNLPVADIAHELVARGPQPRRDL